jgi:L-asparaginase II
VDEPVLVEVVRSGLVESRHRGSVAGLAADGSIAFAIGEPSRPVYGRSANKP